MLKQAICFITLFLALGSAPLSFAEEAASSDGNIIRLSSTGEVKVEPNMALISLTVSHQAKTADNAVKDNAKSMEKVMKSLKAKLGPKDTLQTGQYQLSPVYQRDKDNNSTKIVGYRVANQINIEYHNLASLGDLLDEVVESGINKIDNLRFGHTDTATLQKQALEQAIAQAKVTAEIIAKSAGVTIKGIKEIASYDSNPTPVYREMALAMDAGGPSTQVLPGQITISSNVNMVFAIH